MKQIFTVLFLLGICFSLGGVHHVALSTGAIPGLKSADPASVTFPVSAVFTAMDYRPAAPVSFESAASGTADLNLKVYPNPAIDFIRVEWHTARNIEIHAELYDLFGRRISQDKADDSANHIQIDIRSFQRSAYLLKVFTSDGKFSRTYRIVKY
jgi:hypothetical protein